MPGTTPVYGFPYPEPTDLVADYPALGQDLAEDIEAVLPTTGGLIPAKPTSIANSGGTATLTSNSVTFSAVNSVSLNGVFTATSTVYRIVVAIESQSAETQMYFRMRLAGTDATAGQYENVYFYAYGPSSTGVGSATSATTGEIATTSADGLVSIDLAWPFVARNSMAYINRASAQTSVGRTVITMGAFRHTVATAYDGFTLFPNGGTATGSVSVYGYKK